MKSLFLILFFLSLLGTAKASSELQDALSDASSETVQGYERCLEESTSQEESDACVNEELGDIYN